MDFFDRKEKPTIKSEHVKKLIEERRERKKREAKEAKEAQGSSFWSTKPDSTQANEEDMLELDLEDPNNPIAPGDYSDVFHGARIQSEPTVIEYGWVDRMKIGK